jgi:hypothetical protein
LCMVREGTGRKQKHGCQLPDVKVSSGKTSVAET